MNLGFRADVDPLRRLVQNDHRRPGRQPARQRHFLLVAAGQRADVGEHGRRLDAKLRDVVLRPGDLGGPIDEAAGRDRREAGEAGVRRNGHVEDDPVLPPILGYVGDAGANRVGRRSDRARDSVDADLPASGGVRPKMVSATCVRPEPTSPARPRISPRWTVRVMSRMPAARFEMPRISSAGFPIVTARFGNTEEISRPTIMRISSARSSSLAPCVAIVRPSRSTVIRSETVKISSRRCEM